MEGPIDIPKMNKEMSEEQPMIKHESVLMNTEMIQSEDTRVETERKGAAPGKKLVKVVKTRTFMDAAGYMVTEDYDSIEEQDYVEPVKKAAAKAEKRMPPSN